MAKAANRSKSGKRSKSKGAGAELKIAKLLEAWWSTEEKPARFRRTPGSGGWSRAAENMEGFASAGDIVTTDKSFPFCVEAKFYADYRLEHLITGKAVIMTWWEQAVEQCPAHLYPLLIFRRNNMEELVMFSYGNFPDHNVSISELIKDMNYFKIRKSDQETLFILRLCDLMLINPELISLEPSDIKTLSGGH